MRSEKHVRLVAAACGQGSFRPNPSAFAAADAVSTQKNA